MTEAFWHMDTYPVRNRAAAAIYFMKFTPKPSELVNVGLYNSDTFNVLPFLPSQLLQKKSNHICLSILSMMYPLMGADTSFNFAVIISDRLERSVLPQHSAYQVRLRMISVVRELSFLGENALMSVTVPQYDDPVETKTFIQ